MVTKIGFTMMLFGAVFFAVAMTATDTNDPMHHPAWVAAMGVSGLALFGMGLIIAGVGAIWGI